MARHNTTALPLVSDVFDSSNSTVLYNSTTTLPLLADPFNITNWQDSNSTSQYTYGGRVFVSISVLIISLIGITGNVIVLMAVALSCRLQTITNVFVANLSVADLLMCLCALPNAVIVLIRSSLPPSLENLCLTVAFLSPIASGVIMFSIAAIAVNRMLLITKHATAYKKIYTACTLFPMVVIIWLVPIMLTTILLATGVGRLSYNINFHICLDDNENPTSGLYKFLLAGILYPGPLAITLICYSIIYVFIRRHFKKERLACPSVRILTTTSSPEPNKAQPVVSIATYKLRNERIHKHQIQITKNLFIVSCVCFLLPLPNSVFLMLGLDDLFLYGVIFLFANSAVNPLLYGARHPMFKEIMLCILRHRWADIPEPSRLLKVLLSRGK
ncbi:G-protein coupled receptor moody-like [Patiria miniata]|uniref:G-protein coupled receptors family 1 profile domain-containing protein n=1 Tax=Patiria miniata TaxID=46514 RepID=A0A913Z4S4_PATMI|nr:G-protein coupled receptor moody-like [Patiria miniata]